MKRIMMTFGLLCLMGASECEPRDQRVIAARKLGGDALCTWKSDGTSNHEIICISGGRRFVCLVGESDRVNCALIADSAAEAK